MTERRLVPFAEQIEQRRALREVVVRVGRAAAFGMQAAAEAQIFAPFSRRDRGVERIGRVGQALFGFRQTSRGGEGLSSNQCRLQRVERRGAGVENLVRLADGRRRWV